MRSNECNTITSRVSRQYLKVCLIRTDNSVSKGKTFDLPNVKQSVELNAAGWGGFQGCQETRVKVQLGALIRVYIGGCCRGQRATKWNVVLAWVSSIKCLLITFKDDPSYIVTVEICPEARHFHYKSFRVEYWHFQRSSHH